MTIGILGGGQLGRMLALAGYTLGQRFVFLDPGAESSAGGRLKDWRDEKKRSVIATSVKAHSGWPCSRWNCITFPCHGHAVTTLPMRAW